MERIDPMKFQIIPPFTVNKPTELYKFYRVNSYSIDAVTKGYFYASHPFELNDPFDCFEG
jgi:hypothetical protein